MFKKIIVSIIISIIIVYFVTLMAMHKNYNSISNTLSQRPMKDMYLIKNFLTDTKFSQLKNLVDKHYHYFKVRNDNIVRKGASSSHHQMVGTPLADIINIFDNGETINTIYDKTNLQLQFVPKTDPNRLSVLVYQKPKDGINWHYDGNNYYGNRWAAIYTIVDRAKNGNKSKSQFHYLYNDNEYQFNTPENSLLLFRGDKVKHKVSSLGHDETRIVVSLLFCDICERKLNPIDHIYQSAVNLTFYGKV